MHTFRKTYFLEKYCRMLSNKFGCFSSIIRLGLCTEETTILLGLLNNFQMAQERIYIRMLVRESISNVFGIQHMRSEFEECWPKQNRNPTKPSSGKSQTCHIAQILVKPGNVAASVSGIDISEYNNDRKFNQKTKNTRQQILRKVRFSTSTQSEIDHVRSKGVGFINDTEEENKANVSNSNDKNEIRQHRVKSGSDGKQSNQSGEGSIVPKTDSINVNDEYKSNRQLTTSLSTNELLGMEYADSKICICCFPVRKTKRQHEQH